MPKLCSIFRSDIW